MNIRKGLTSGFLVFLLVGLLAFAFPGGSALAQAPTPQPKKDPQVQGARMNVRLEKAFQALQKLVEKQSQNIRRADAFIGKVEGLIGKAKANGKDTRALEAAVTEFKSKRAEAAQLNSAAANILKTHAGFDANGKVTNPEQAKETLKNGREQVKDAREVFTGALKQLRDAFKTWRSANPPATQK